MQLVPARNVRLRELARDVVLVRLAVVTWQVKADRGAVADLAIIIQAPEVDLAARRQRGAEPFARGHLHHAARECDQRRRRGVGAG